MPRTAAKAAELEVLSLPQIAYAQLRDDILTGRHEAGSPLRQEELAQKMGVSRVPLREALRRLEVEGLVVQRPRRGYIVSSLDPEDIEDIFDIRAMLEERAGYLAAKHRTAADVAEVEALLKAMDGLVIREAADVDLFAERNHAFHARLFQASGRKQLCRTMIVLRNSVERYIRIGAFIAGNLDRVKLDHYRIVDAFRRGDAEETGRLSRAHCEHTCERLVARLREERGKSG